MRPQIVNVIPGVLDVEWTNDNHRAAARGEKMLADPRLQLETAETRQRYVADGLGDGSLNMDGAIWLAPAVDRSA